MSEERKPVVCPYCGREMELKVCVGDREDDDYGRECQGHYVCGCGSCTPTAQHYEAYVEEAAYLAATATQRPPDRALTREQVEALPNDDAVWIYESNGSDAWVHSVSFVKNYMLFEKPGTYIFFATKPTPADIEAARKEHP